MPCYSETDSHELRLKVEEIVLEWPGVSKKMIFGSPAYVTGKTYFTMQVAGGLSLPGSQDKRRNGYTMSPAWDISNGTAV
ncbi:MAG: hypothetical protein WCJ93_05080 [Methanomicrobiales archaeon]